MKYAAGKRSLVEIGVMHGVNTALLRSVMDPSGTITGIDPHPPGRLGVSFEQWIGLREVARYPRGRIVLLRRRSHDSPHVVPGSVVTLHDSRSAPGAPELDSVRYTRAVILADPGFRLLEAVESLTLLERMPAGSPR